MQLQYNRAGRVHLVNIYDCITRLHKPIRVQMTHWMRMGSQLKTRGKVRRRGCNKAGRKEKVIVTDVMEVGSLVSSTDFNNLVNATHLKLIKINCQRASHQLCMTLVTSLSFSSQTKRRKPHEAHSTD